MKKAILFDIDGTILDASDFVFDAVRFTANKYKQPYPSKEFISKALGKSLVEFYTIVLPDLDPKELAKTHHRFQQKNFHLIKIFPKAKQVLKSLKDAGYSLAAVSNRSRESLIPSLHITEIFEYFDVIVTPDDVENPKPHQDHPLAALNKLQVKTEDAHIVGDTENDILAGKNAKIKTVGVTYGWLGKDIKKHNPDYVIDDIGQLLHILK